MLVKVAHITLSMGTGGIEKLIISLFKATDPTLVEYRLYCLDAGGELLNEAEMLGVPTKVFCRRPGLDLQLIFKLAKAFSEDSLDVVHTHNQAAHFYGSLAAKIAGVPIVINTEHSRHYIQDHWRRRFEKRMLSMITTYMVTVSKDLCLLSTEDDRIAPNKLRVIVNGVDVQRYDNVEPEAVSIFQNENGITPSTKVLCIIARLHPIKNHSLLLQAVKLLMFKFPDVRLLIVGDGTERESLEQLSEELDITSNVSFLGNRNDVSVILKACDAAVLCSHTEGLPLVLLEAMAAQTPIIVTKGANRSGLIVHGVNGLVAGDNSNELAMAISDIFTNKVNRLEMTHVAYYQVLKQFSIEMTAKDYSYLYTQGEY